jgi:hypothetical protein
VSATFQHEDVSQAPRGWRVRTVSRGRHRLRIAFPPGRPRTGSGQLVQILHPPNENPVCRIRQINPAPELMVMTANRKESDAQQKARQATELWARGMMQGGHPFTKQEYGDMYRTALRHYQKNPGELLVLGANPKRRVQTSARRRNPDAEQRAAELYEKFHGKSPTEIVELQESDAARHVYTSLGKLVELQIHPARGGKTLAANFNGDSVTLASTPNGRQLYLLGGNQNLNGMLEKFAADPSKDLVDLGEAHAVVYRAAKAQSGFKPGDFIHEFGEESGVRPQAFYDRLKQRVFLMGGDYRVEAPGIIN